MRPLMIMVLASLSGCTLLFDGSDLRGTGGGQPDLSVPGGDMTGGGGDMTGSDGGGGGDMTGGGPDMLAPLTTVEFTKTPASPLAIGTGPYYIAAGDLDGDGNMDLVTTNNTDDNFSFMFGNGAGLFTVINDRPSGLSTMCSVHALAVARFNADARDDVAFTCTDGNTNNTGGVLLFNANRTYTFMSSPEFASLTEVDPNFMTAGDLDGDGNQDLVVTAQAINSVWILLGNGNGSFKTRKVITTGALPYWAAVGRVNADALLDVVTANYTDGNVSVILQTSMSNFGTATPFSASTEAATVVIGEFTGDANGDLVVSSAETGMTSVKVLTGNGLGGFAAPGAPKSVAAYPYAIASGDFNRDGRTDVVTANTAADNCSLMISDGTNGFKAAMPLPCGVAAGGVVAVDLNKDGVPDIASCARSVPPGVHILLNTSH